MAMPDKIWSNGVLVEEKLMDFPGFRFYPTEEELLSFYLKKRIQPGHGLNFDKIMPTLDLYQYDPWELPGLAHDAGERQWFFFVPRYHKKCARPNRLTMSGYWKATGSDRKIRNGPLHCIGLKKTLVFYKGKGPRGQKTDWIMNEYRMPDLSSSAPQNQMDMVLCRIYRKAAAQKSLEQRSKPNDAEKEEPVVSSDEYEEKSDSLALNVSCAQSNPMIKAKVSSLNYVDHDDVCSFLSKTKDESNVFDSLEPLTFCEDQETLVLKTTESCKPPQLELPKLSMDFLFNKQIATPYALLATPSPFQIPHSSIPGL